MSCQVSFVSSPAVLKLSEDADVTTVDEALVGNDRIAHDGGVQRTKQTGIFRQTSHHRAQCRSHSGIKQTVRSLSAVTTKAMSCSKNCCNSKYISLEDIVAIPNYICLEDTRSLRLNVGIVLTQTAWSSFF